MFAGHQPRRQSDSEDGSWLSTPGPYRDYIAASCKLHPTMKWPDSKNFLTPLEAGNARVVLLDFGQGEQVLRSDFSTAAELSKYLTLSSTQAAPPSVPPRRLFIMEGLAPDFIAVLGGHFHIDPMFFVFQERTTLWGYSYEGSRQTPCLPSLVDPEKTFMLRYYDIRDFGKFPTFNMWCARTSRSITGIRTARPDLHNHKFEPIAIVHRKCSFWSRDDHDGWAAVALCDPPVEQIFVRSDRQRMLDTATSIDSTWIPTLPRALVQVAPDTMYAPWIPGVPSPPLQMVPSVPFGGGYRDFIKHSQCEANVPAGPPRTSMLDDLCFYILEHSHRLSGQPGPATAAIFMKKIAASHYMQLIDIIRANIWNIQYQLTCRDSLDSIKVAWIEGRWSDLQSWSRQCSQYIGDVEAILVGLDIPFSASPIPQSSPSDWASSERDFQYIHYQLKSLKAQVEAASNSVTGLAGIAGNRQALEEAKRSLREAKGIKTLTLLGMVFIPLAFCTGLFSMNDAYLPGTPSFWVYFAVAVPLVIVVFLLAFLIGFGYNNEGQWSVQTFISALSNIKVSAKEM